MWIVETGTALLNGKAFVAEHTHKFPLKKEAVVYFEKYTATLTGGTGYWYGMRVKTARMCEM